MTLVKPKIYTPKVGGLKYLQEKLNGWRVIIRNGRAYSRTQDITNLWPEHLKKILNFHTSLDGELHSPLEPSSNVIHLLKESPRSRELTFSPFALPDSPQAKFDSVMNMLESHGFTVPYWRPIVSSIDTQDLLDEARHRRIEGWILKRAHYEGWYKLKPERTVDCIVTRVNPGTVGGKYEGLIGSLEVSLKNEKNQLQPVADVSGLTDEQRKWNYLGLVIEVAYQDIGSKGRLLHPRFKRLRPDKPAHECTINQLKEETN